MTFRLNQLHISAIVIGIVLTGLALRLIGISFGFPSLYDPDEAVFVITGLRMLHDHTLNPGWFGHPGSTTIYVIAVIELIVIGIGSLSGIFPSEQAFGQAVYTNPAIVFLPARLFIVLCGLACIALTYVIGKRLFDRRVGLTAALLLAIAPLHITYSQIIRTDMHSTVFMLLCILSCIRIAEHGKLKDYLVAAIWVALACATKWPSATIAIAILGAAAVHVSANPTRVTIQIRNAMLTVPAFLAALFVASPYIFLAFRTTIANVAGEAQAKHLGSTGGGPVNNLLWYLRDPLLTSFGYLGIALAVFGIVLIMRRNRIAAATIVLAGATFLMAISAQTMIWARWVVPILPFVTIFVAVGFWGLVEWLTAQIGRQKALSGAGLIFAGLAIPMLFTAVADARERLVDTRALSSAWASEHIPKGSTVLIEYLAIDLLHQDWTILYPAGEGGCIDAVKALKGQVRVSTVAGLRGNRAIIDIGTLAPSTLATCKADYAIYTDYDRYRAERALFPAETAIYEKLARGGSILKTFAPQTGAIGGPIVRIVKLPKQTTLVLSVSLHD